MLTLFHDYTSPASAVAVHRLERLAEGGVPVEFVGFEALGVDMTLPVTVDVLAELDSVAEEARAEGVTLRRPSGLPPTGLAHVVERTAAAQGRDREWRRTAYTAFWEHGADLSDVAVLMRLAEDAGLDPGPVGRTIADRVALAAARRRTTEHRRDGVGGVPMLLAHSTLVPGLLPEEDLRALAL